MIRQKNKQKISKIIEYNIQIDVEKIDKPRFGGKTLSENLINKKFSEECRALPLKI